MNQINNRHKQSRRKTRFFLLFFIAITAIAAVMLTGCDSNSTGIEENPTPDLPSATLNNPGTLKLFIVNKDGKHLVQVQNIDPSTVLYDFRAPENVIVDPEGNPITWDEFNNVKGTATVKCVEGGTRISVELSGLIPNGLYTIWNVVLHKPGFQGTFGSMLKSIVGVTPLGAPDGSENVFYASANGTAKITGFTPKGSVLQFPDVDKDWPDKRGIKKCALDEFEFHVVGDYHYNGKTYGNVPGPAGTHVEQFGFVFNDETTDVKITSNPQLIDKRGLQ